MGKYADRYFVTEEMGITEEGFNPEYAQVAESVMSIGNEYMGVRGYYDEGYSKEHLQGSYFNGLYEFAPTPDSAYKGIASGTEFMVNSVDWLYTRIYCQGEQLDLAVSKTEQFYQHLDFGNGVLKRSFIWVTKAGHRIRLTFERLVSMEYIEYGAQRITAEALEGDSLIEMRMGLDLTTVHRSIGKNLWICDGITCDIPKISIWGHTRTTGMKLKSMAVIHGISGNGTYECTTGKVYISVRQKLEKNNPVVFEKVVRNLVNDRADNSDGVGDKTFENLKASNAEWWSKTWSKADIRIDGDAVNQQGIRFCIFQMFQTYHGAVPGTNIGAKGLTGEAYNGNAFWDTETYCLPFYLWNDAEAARNLLYFRYRTLDEARKRAEELDCKGAFYPIATISGRECCNLWQHASLQLQASTGVAYGIWLYEKLYHDTEFLEQYGLEMLVEISRMLATRGAYDPDGNYGFFCVMGPDEFQMMVNHNCYTNFMGKFTLKYTLDCIVNMKAENPDAYRRLCDRIHITEAEINEWSDIQQHMYIPYDETRKLYEQHDGYFKLPHIDIRKIPAEEFSLYSHWSYDRIYRNDMIKQPDVLMMMFLFGASFTDEQLKANYEFYEPRCIHESSLSPSVHSILASRLGKTMEAYDFFGFATRMDLDNYNRNTAEGIHTTSIAAAWMNIVYGFGGLRCDGDVVNLSPSLPESWNGFSFRLNRAGWSVLVEVRRDKVRLICEGQYPTDMYLYNTPVDWDHNGCCERKLNELDV